MARQVVRVARRRTDLPVAIGALAAGELSLDQVALIARHVPARYDEAATELARHTTVAQLERVLPRYAWDDDAATDDPPAGDPPAGEDPPAADPGESGTRRGGGFRFDDDGFGRFTATLPTDEAMLLEAALKAARADLLSEWHEHEHSTPGEPVPYFGDADALIAIVRSYLSGGRLHRPGADRYLVHAHLEQHPDATPVLRSHLGPILPDALRRYLTCDCDLRPVWNVHGTPLSVGRTQRLVPDRTRRVIEHRDGGCIVPGCGRRSKLDIHHIVHWEHGGPTDTSNLCCLCHKHHRQHHLGLLGITGNADTPGGLLVTDQWDRPMQPTGTPKPIQPGHSAHETATQRGVPAPKHHPATGERLHTRDVWLSPAPPPRLRT